MMFTNDVGMILKAVRDSTPIKLKAKIPEADEDVLWEYLWNKQKGGFDRGPLMQGTAKFGYIMLQDRIAEIDTVLTEARANIFEKCDTTVFFSTQDNSQGLDWHNDEPSYVLGGNLVGSTVWHSKNKESITLDPGDMIFMPSGVYHRVEVLTTDRITFGIYGDLKDGFFNH